MKYRIDFESMEWEMPIEGMRCKIGKKGNKQLRLVEYTRDMEPHWCEKGHIGYVLEGEFEIRFRGGLEVFNVGDGIFIGSGKEHEHMGRVISDKVRVVFVEDA